MNRESWSTKENRIAFRNCLSNAGWFGKLEFKICLEIRNSDFEISKKEA